MAYDLQEQEQIASLKAWWERYGNTVTYLILGVALAVGAYNLWQVYQSRQVAAASAAYGELTRAVTAKDLGRVKEFSGVLVDKYGSTGYAQMGALLAAKANVEGGDAKTGKAQLRWVADHAIDPEYRAVAALRLAGVLLDEGSYDDAMKEVATTVSADLSVQLQAAFADRRGDIDVAQGKADEAQREYRAAIVLLESRSDARGYANVVQLKLDALLGGTVASADAAPKPAAAPAAPAPAEVKK